MNPNPTRACIIDAFSIFNSNCLVFHNIVKFFVKDCDYRAALLARMRPMANTVSIRPSPTAV